MRIAAVIPARGGSKGIPRKNIASLGGQPLIAWTIHAALACTSLTRVIVSTDDEEIASVARVHGAEVPFLRPAEFSGDVAPAIDVIRHAIQELVASGDAGVDAIAYLQPTSPFRTARQLDEAMQLFINAHCDTLVSMMQVPHNMVPSSVMRASRDGSVRMEIAAGQLLRRQDKESLYARNGPAILIVSVPFVLGSDSLYAGSVAGFEMDRLSSLDIDDATDLDIARCLLPLLSPAPAQKTP